MILKYWINPLKKKKNDDMLKDNLGLFYLKQ